MTNARWWRLLWTLGLAACAAPPSPPVAPAPRVDAPAAASESLLWPADRYPQGAPLSQGTAAEDKPSLAIYAAPGPGPHPAIVVCPGGGYGFLAKDHEGRAVGEFCQQHGISAFVLSYRIAPKYQHPCPLLDVQRALRTVRARAVEWQVDAAHLGVMGFSAGGHLASTAATWHDAGDANASDPIERASCRPDFAVLVYPVIAFDKPWTHEGSKHNLLGAQLGDAALVARLSTANSVDATTPPCFLLHTTGDTVVPAENSVDFYLALRRAKVPAELHVYERGEHGFGLGGNDAVLSAWPRQLLAWLKGLGADVRD